MITPYFFYSTTRTRLSHSNKSKNTPSVYFSLSYTAAYGGGAKSRPESSDFMDTGYLANYLPILVFLVIAVGISTLMVVAAFLLAKQKPDSEKLSAYECGFPAFDNAHRRFDVRYYLVAILFIIFDLEVAFLFPWAVSLGTIGVFGFWSMMVFLGVLTVGFIYEWKKGALEWE